MKTMVSSRSVDQLIVNRPARILVVILIILSPKDTNLNESGPFRSSLLSGVERALTGLREVERKDG